MDNVTRGTTQSEYTNIVRNKEADILARRGHLEED